jgi:hypothetical protein
MTIEEDNKYIEKFRGILKKIKVNVLNNYTYNDQNMDALQKVSKRLIQFYHLLYKVVFDNLPVSTIPVIELQKVFYETLEEYKPRSPYYQTRLEYFLRRDFLDFQFTIDEESINNYNGYLEPHRIIENNITLTDR